MNSFNYRTVTTRLFNQPVTFEVCGRIFDCGKIELTELYAVDGDELICVDDMLNLPAIEKAIVSLLNEWPHGLIFKGDK